jgi:hypothetical protein
MSNTEKRHFFLAHLTLVMTTHKYFRSPAPALTLTEKYIGFRPRGRRPQMQNQIPPNLRGCMMRMAAFELPTFTLLMMLPNRAHVTVDKCRTEMGRILAPRKHLIFQFRNVLHTHKGTMTRHFGENFTDKNPRSEQRSPFGT